MNPPVKTYDELLRDFYCDPPWRRDQLLRDWMKPRIRRVAGVWICSGRGFSATGFSPAAAYGIWVVLQRPAITSWMQFGADYATKSDQGSCWSVKGPEC